MYQKLIIVGRLGQDPELRFTPAGGAVCTMSLAVSKVRKDEAGERQEQTTWFRVVAFGQTAENCAKYLKKGSTALVEGEIRTSQWEDRESGQKRYGWDVMAGLVRFLGKPGGQKEEVEAPGDGEPGDEEIPF